MRRHRDGPRTADFEACVMRQNRVWRRSKLAHDEENRQKRRGAGRGCSALALPTFFPELLLLALPERHGPMKARAPEAHFCRCRAVSAAFGRCFGGVT